MCYFDKIDNSISFDLLGNGNVNITKKNRETERNILNNDSTMEQ